MKDEPYFGKALIAPAVALAAVFAPQTLLFAAGMYAVGKVSGAYLESAVYNTAQMRRNGYEGDAVSDLAEAAGTLGNSFVKTVTPFCPVASAVAVAAGALLNRKTKKARFKEPKLNDKPVIDL